MFEEIVLWENDNADDMSDVANEAELAGNVGPDKHIHFSNLLSWMNDVGASGNAKYLKCLNYRTSRVEVNNIVDVTFSENLMHKDVTFAHGVKIAFKEGGDVPAMTLGRATELFNAVAAKCEEEGIALEDVEVFVEDGRGKLTQFCWFYDTDTDTACIVKNMNPKMAARFMREGADAVVNKAAKSATTPDSVINELAKIEEQMKALEAKRDAAYSKLEGLPPVNEDDDSEDDDSDDVDA